MIKGDTSNVQNINLSYKLKEVTGSDVLHVYKHQRIVDISASRCLIEMEFGSNGSTLMDKQFIIYCKIKLEYCHHVTHSPWSCHICVNVYVINMVTLTLLKTT